MATILTIKSAVTSYFTNLFTRPNMRRAIMGDWGFKRLSMDQSAFLERPITLDEAHEAVLDCDSLTGRNLLGQMVSTSDFTGKVRLAPYLP